MRSFNKEKAYDYNSVVFTTDDERTTYKVNVPNWLVEKVDDMLADMSCHLQDRFIEVYNQDLKNVIMARQLAAIFFKQNLKVAIQGFSTIEANIDGEINLFTIGAIDIEQGKVEYMAGPLYKE